MNDESKYSLIWNIRYAMRFGRRQARLLDAIARLIKILTIIAGSAAFISVIGDNEDLTKWSGLAVAALAVVDFAWNPSALACKSREMEMRFALLNRDAPKLTAEELQRAIDELYDAETPEVDSLRPVVYNDVASEYGNSQDELYPLTPWQKVIGFLA